MFRGFAVFRRKDNIKCEQYSSTPNLLILKKTKFLPCDRDLFGQASHGSQTRVKPFGRDIRLDSSQAKRYSDDTIALQIRRNGVSLSTLRSPLSIGRLGNGIPAAAIAEVTVSVRTNKFAQ